MILFDYGGTLLYEPNCNFLNGERKVFEHVAKNPNNLSPEEVSQFETDLFESYQEYRDSGYEAHGIQILRLKYEYNEIELDISFEEAEIILWSNTSPMTEESRMPHVLEMLDFLKREGIRSAVISNIGWSGYALNDRIQCLLPDNEFEFIVASSEYGIRKPNPMIFELVLKKAGLRSEDVWYCGDTFDMDVEGAHNAGIFPIYYQGVAEDGPKRDNKEVKTDYSYLKIVDWLELIDLLQEETARNLDAQQ